MAALEELLREHGAAAQRYVRYRLPSAADAEDVLQEVYLTAWRDFGRLKSTDAFRAWLIGIARNKCSDYFRAKARGREVPLDEELVQRLSHARFGRSIRETVRDTLETLSEQDRRMLELFFWQGMSQMEISRLLDIPLGTVKSRIHTAKQHFRQAYPHDDQQWEEEKQMTRLPVKMPAYRIIPASQAPFETVCEELMGWMAVPRLGEKLSWGLYEGSTGLRTEYTEIRAVGKAEVHGIEGVELSAVQYNAEDYYRTGSVDRMERRFVAQLTDTHCRYLAESHVENGVRKCYTFLDGEPFMNNWGFGEDNCGSETHLAAKGHIVREGNTITVYPKDETMDVVGRYTVEINAKSYDTICLMDVSCFNDAVASEQYVDRNGRTVLWRRFNRDDWAFKRYQQRWTEKLPENERLQINGETYVHWYDCISDYIL